MNDDQIALGEYVMLKTENLTGLDTSAVRRAIPISDREEARALTVRERSSFFVQLYDQMSAGEAWVQPVNVESAFPPAQSLGIMLPAYPGQPPHQSSIFTLIDSQQRDACDIMYRQHADFYGSRASPPPITRFLHSIQMSQLLGTQDPSLDQEREHLDMLRGNFTFSASGTILDRPGELDADGNAMTLSRVYNELRERTHQLVCVGP